MIQAGTLVQPLLNLLRDRLLSYDILQMKRQYRRSRSPAKQPGQNSYLRVQRGGARATDRTV